MPIIVDIDVMLARRKMAVGTLADLIGITPANLAVLKNGRAKAVRFSTLDALCQALDCQHMPVSHARFQRMRLFGGNKLRASVVLYPPTDAHAPRRSDSSTSSAKGTER